MAKSVVLVLSDESVQRLRSIGKFFNREEKFSLGFSLGGFFFGELMLLYKTLWGTHIIADIILTIVANVMVAIFYVIASITEGQLQANIIITFVIIILLANGIIIGLKINKWYVKKLIYIGYIPATQKDREILVKKGIWLTKEY